MSKEAVEEYLRAQNRPYSTNDLVSNLLNAYPKSVVQKALDVLVAEEVVSEKVNGKQKAYVINQEHVETLSEKDQLELESQLKEKQSVLDNMQGEMKGVESKLKNLSNELTMEEAVGQLQSLKEEMEAKKSKLELLREQSKDKVVISKEAKMEKEKQLESYVKAWKQRKRSCNAILDAILENYNKPRKTFMEDVGIETDESVNQVVPSI